MVDYIPEEILVQVLKRLPVKSLVRSRCVCKWWKQLIDSPSFVLDHLAFQTPRFFITDLDYYEEPDFLLLDPQTLPLVDILPYSSENWSRVNLALMGTLHEIVCLYKHCFTTCGIYLWNPSMRKLLNVPVPEYMHCYKGEDLEGPGNYPPTCFAFWIDPLTKHFKMVVVTMVYHYGEFEKFGATYSSIEGDWKKISLGQLTSIADYDLHPVSEDPGLMMGKLAYWRAYYYTPKGLEDVYCHKRDVVISFDFEQERFDSIEGPSVTFQSYPWFNHWQGSLSLVYLDWENKCDFYSMREGSWVNLFCISLTPNISRVYCIVKETEENGKILLAETTYDELVLFDTIGFRCVTLKSADDKPKFHGQMVHNFVESLVFP